VIAFLAGCARAQPSPPPDRAQPASLAQWAWVVIAGDDEAAHAETPTRAFDNARRDVVTAFSRRGFSPENLAQFSVAGQPGAEPSESNHIFARLAALAKSAPAGCLIYLTSHGSPRGALVGDDILPPSVAAAKINHACGDRPTAIIISACFSGTYLPRLGGSNHLVMTAARRDRSSFGCGEDDVYPFFDGCVIKDLPAARDFVDLAERVRRCVAEREDQEGMRPRSQPQTFVGKTFLAQAPYFAGP
jgi:hypothetical protein